MVRGLALEKEEENRSLRERHRLEAEQSAQVRAETRHTETSFLLVIYCYYSYHSIHYHSYYSYYSISP